GLKGFHDAVAARYQSSDPALSTEIVYGGKERPAPEVCRLAEQLRVRLRSFVEYQGITDFREYVKRQTSALANDKIYPPSLYVPQHGGMVFDVDGFDERSLRMSNGPAAERFETILQATSADAKVIVTSRTQHFESEKQVRTVLYGRAQPGPGLRYCKLLKFED